MYTYFFTGFPGFIATQLIHSLIHEFPDSRFKLLIHPSQLKKAQAEVKKLIQANPFHHDRFTLIPGDITANMLGIDSETNDQIRQEIDYVFHLAAIYDLAVPYDFAYRVNVEGTQNVTRWVKQLPRLKRYVYFSTAYVSGRRTGKILETELDKGQAFKNHYEATKFQAEVIVQQHMDQIPTTIIRPGIVMGHSQTGETVKFDGPYFVMRFLDKFASFPIPYIGRGEAYIHLVPVDYIIRSTIYLVHHAASEGKVYHLTTPQPYKAKEIYRLICEALINKTPSYTIPSSLVYGLLAIPPFRRWVKVEKETVEYFNHQAEYDCTQAQQDLQGSGIVCPDFTEFIKRAVHYYKEHRYDPDKLIPVR
jgi:nucleoside-diphosphate-sugar epimerase